MRKLSLLLLVLISLSCGTDNTTQNNSLPSGVEKNKNSIDFENKSIDFLNAKISSNTLDIKGSSIVLEDFQSEVNNGDIEYLIKKLKEKSGLNLSLTTGLIAFYLDNKFSKTIKLNDIKSFSIIYPVSEEVNRHELYRVDSKNNFKLVQEYTDNVGILLMNDFRYIAPEILPSSKFISIVTLKSKKYNIATRTYVPMPFSEKVIDNAHFLMNNYGECATNCFGSGPQCEVGPVDVPGTCYGACPMEEVSSQIQERNLRVSASLSKEKAYQIRDEVLVKSKKGKKYKEFYYKIAEVSNRFKTVNSRTLRSHMEVATILINAADVLENGRDNEKVISLSSAEKVSSLLRNYRSVSKNSEYQDILNEIDHDLQFVTDKSKKEVLKFMQND